MKINAALGPSGILGYHPGDGESADERTTEPCLSRRCNCRRGSPHCKTAPAIAKENRNRFGRIGNRSRIDAVAARTPGTALPRRRRAQSRPASITQGTAPKARRAIPRLSDTRGLVSSGRMPAPVLSSRGPYPGSAVARPSFPARGVSPARRRCYPTVLQAAEIVPAVTRSWPIWPLSGIVRHAGGTPSHASWNASGQGRTGLITTASRTAEDNYLQPTQLSQ